MQDFGFTQQTNDVELMTSEPKRGDRCANAGDKSLAGESICSTVCTTPSYGHIPGRTSLYRYAHEGL